MILVLTSISGEKRRTFRFAKDVVTIGRSEACVLTLDDPALSRTHCQIETLGGGVYVRDLNSRNGTRVRGQAVRRARLRPGEEVVIGTLRLVFEGLEERESSGLGLRTMELFRERGIPPQQRDEELRAFATIAASLLEDLDEEAVLARVLDLAVDMAGAERGFLLLFEGDEVSVEVARTDWRRDIDDPEVEVSHGIAHAVREAGRALVIDDAEKDARTEGFLSVNALALRSVLAVPLHAKEQTLGVLYLDHRLRARRFGASEVQRLETFAAIAAAALESSGRFTEVHRRTRELEEEVARNARALSRAQEALARKTEAKDFRHRFDGVVAHAPAMRRALELLDRAIPTNLPLVLQGPAGGEGEALARIVHEQGAHKDGRFVVLACAALPASLAEVELFGHGAGAFTGASEARPGLIERADGGTLFLDRIEDLGLEAQALFLRVLEDGSFRRLGDATPRAARLRVIATTSADLPQRVREGRFREDLWFRLSGLVVRVPSLAERAADLPELLDRLLGEEAPEVELTAAARKELLTRPWPGDLLEMRNAVRRLALHGPGSVDVDALPGSAREEPAETPRLKDAVHALEARLIRQVLEEEGGNLSRTAERLGLSRPGLRAKMERLDLGEG